LKKTNFKIKLATISDVEALTNLHCESFKPEDHVPMLFGKSYIRAIFRWIVSSPYTYILIAKDRKEIIGFQAVSDGTYVKKMFFACFSELIISIVLNPQSLVNKLLWRRLFRKSENIKVSENQFNQDDFARLIIGVVEKKNRGKGVFGELLRETKEYSKKRGSKVILTGVYKTNESSIKGLMKSDWIEVPEMETVDTVSLVVYLEGMVVGKSGIMKPKSNY